MRRVGQRNLGLGIGPEPTHPHPAGHHPQPVSHPSKPWYRPAAVGRGAQLAWQGLAGGLLPGIKFSSA